MTEYLNDLQIRITVSEFLTSALNGCGWLDLHLGRFTLEGGCSGQSVGRSLEEPSEFRIAEGQKILFSCLSQH